MSLDYVQEEVARCAYCGFCDIGCPTDGPKWARHYTPRGRVEIIRLAITEGTISEEALKGLHTCLLCKGCEQHCPVDIEIAAVIREFLHLWREGELDVILEGKEG